jgi:hypothetical protein
MTPVLAQRHEDLLSDCVVSPHVFDHIADRLCNFVVPYQQYLETEAGKRNVHRYLKGLLSHLERKHVEEASVLNVEMDRD